MQWHRHGAKKKKKKKKGEINVPSVKIKYEAIKLGWLKRWWCPEPNRLEWAWITNEIAIQSTHNTPKLAKPMITEWISQTWPVKTCSNCLPESLKEMIEAAKKYNATISVMRAPLNLHLKMPAFHHPFAKNRNLQHNSKTMKCLQENHKVRTIKDLVKMTIENEPNLEINCTGRKPRGNNCKNKAQELLTQINKSWNPNQETPRRHNLWHTPQRINRHQKSDPESRKVLYNPDTRSKHCLLGGIRILGKLLGHKSTKRDPFLPAKELPRIDKTHEPSGVTIKISADGSALKNGWENAEAGIGVWYRDSCRRNIKMKLESKEMRTASNSRAELGAILEALRQNEVDDLEIESDSLTSLRAICKLSEGYKDINWVGVQNEDLLKGILIKLRTRNAETSFKWVKGHADDYGNNRADALADEGRNSNSQMVMDEEEWYDNHPALQDGARLQALEAKHMYKLLLKWHTKKIAPILHQDKLEEVKTKVEQTTGL